MTRHKSTLAALVVASAAMIALGQNADKNSAGPTKNDYRLRVVEPAEGAVIAGSTVRVVVNTEIPAEVGDTRRDVNSMPRPDVDVFLDGRNEGSMRDASNVLTIDSVRPGEHRIVLLAKNRANEIIDRKEVHFTSTAASAAAGTTTRTDATLEPAAPAPAPGVSVHDDGSTAMAPSSTASSSSSPSRPVFTASGTDGHGAAERRTLPETATNDPLLLAGGATLLLGGLLVRRVR